MVPSNKEKQVFEKINNLILKLEKSGITRKDIIKKLQEKSEGIPLSVFKNDFLAPLEAITKYMRENLNLSYKEIAYSLGRNPIPIGITYREAVTKMKTRLDDTSLDKIPTFIFKNRRLSVLENIVFYLKSNGMRYNEIAQAVNRDDRTIWTVYNRALKKGDQK